MQCNTASRRPNMWGSINGSQEGAPGGEIPFQPPTKSAKEADGIKVERSDFNIITPSVLFGT